jgi:hypothetical protein
MAWSTKKIKIRINTPHHSYVRIDPNDVRRKFQNSSLLIVAVAV